jgi:hypothetical protein
MTISDNSLINIPTLIERAYFHDKKSNAEAT